MHYFLEITVDHFLFKNSGFLVTYIVVCFKKEFAKLMVDYLF